MGPQDMYERECMTRVILSCPRLHFLFSLAGIKVREESKEYRKVAHTHKPML